MTNVIRAMEIQKVTLVEREKGKRQEKAKYTYIFKPNKHET